jgi:hypothetical protein
MVSAEWRRAPVSICTSDNRGAANLAVNVPSEDHDQEVKYYELV